MLLIAHHKPDELFLQSLTAYVVNLLVHQGQVSKIAGIYKSVYVFPDFGVYQHLMNVGLLCLIHIDLEFDGAVLYSCQICKLSALMCQLLL